jgi:hypothetical protein
MKCFDFFLKAQYCDVRTNTIVGNRSCTPNEETKQWFADQGIRIWVGYQGEMGVLLTALDVTDDQALLIQLSFDVHPETQELYERAELRLTL